MKNIKAYHGFLGLPRHSKLLLNDLGYDLFGFYLGLIMEAAWYRGNPWFMYVKKTQKELATELVCNQSTVSRNLTTLENKRYVIRHTKNRLIRVVYFPLFLTDVSHRMHSKNYANLHELYADMHSINAELQEKYAKAQEDRGTNVHQRLYGSFKENSGSFNQEIKSEKGASTMYDQTVRDI